MCFCDFLLIFSYFKGVEKGVKSCYEQNRKEGSFSRQFGTQILKNIYFHFLWNSTLTWPNKEINKKIENSKTPSDYRIDKYKCNVAIEDTEIHVTQQIHEASGSQRHLVDMLVGSRYTKLQVSIVLRFVRGETQKSIHTDIRA